MFDGLREKLGRFSDDVEEDVDAEATDEGEADADTGEVDDTAADTQPTDSDAIDDTEVAAESADGTAAEDAAATAEDATATAEDATATAEDATATADDATAAGESDTSSEDASDADRGVAERAKLFATGKTVIDEDDLADHLDDLELALLSSDVEMSVADEILAGVESNLVGETRRRLQSTGNLVQDALREALFDVISVGQFDFEDRIAEAEKPVVIIFTGVNGVGKTTTIAKLASYLEDRGYSSVLANGDTYRAGANQQLGEHAEALDVPYISHEQGGDPTAVIYDAVEYAEANDVDVVLGDTAGRLHTSEGLMDQLSKIERIIEPDMTLFVDEAVAGQDAVTRATEFNNAAEVDGAILTKADADPQGGAAISIAHVTGKPILFLGTGQGYEHLDPFDPKEVVDQLTLGE
ncbi:Signal recognition particle receptor FtsY protein [Halorhabdus tiamatea SARL4B]|uniref:Signal recognition particle receptor FtsY n=1 Tax=Halorhabdus tiamatea SARL4B TaxID=1033806 RepID=F7PIT5_9EURY|nr:signal recognition particle-docking protein FtsY [Halorhabdus tiamatea]ERJ05426.1 Signal recognition particle receptor FtsY protein [Halorhabdus tiamatea SARL4B]CCQ33347.1 cell division signal recognition particle receptor protein FtsY [Halorhabdus tiamatea SARL4B]